MKRQRQRPKQVLKQSWTVTRTVFLFGLLSGLFASASSTEAEVKFKHHFIDASGISLGAWGTNVIADMDHDGRLDVVISRAPYGKGPRGVFWYRNEGRINQWSEIRTIRSGITPGCGAVVFDVDGDGWNDFVADQWLKNPGPADGKQHQLAGEFAIGKWDLGEKIHDLETADFDHDGYPEIVANVQFGDVPGLYVFRSTNDPTSKWNETLVTKVDLMRSPKNRPKRGAVHAAVSPRGIGDLDGDGDLDIAYLDSWCENVDGHGNKWKTHDGLGFRPRGAWGTAVRCWVADIDRDGHNDIVQSVCDAPGKPVIWLRNAIGDGSRWDLQTIPFPGKPGDFHSLAVADFDLDGDVDVYVDEMEHLHLPKGRETEIGMWVFENIDGKGSEWKPRKIVTGIGGHQAQIADIDGDGDVDVVTRPYNAANVQHGGRMHVSVLENLTKRPNATGKGSGFGRLGLNPRK